MSRENAHHQVTRRSKPEVDRGSRLTEGGSGTYTPAMTTPEPPPRCGLPPIVARLLAKPLGFVTAVCIAATTSAGPALGKSPEHASAFPIRGLHLSAPAKKDLPVALD